MGIKIPDCDDPDAGHGPDPALKLLQLFVQGVDGGHLIAHPELFGGALLAELMEKSKALLREKGLMP